MEAAKYNRCQVQHSRLVFSTERGRLFQPGFCSADPSVTFSPVILCFQTALTSGFRRRDAGGERERGRRPPGQAEEEVPQPVDPQDQQHRAGSLRPAERHAGGTGDGSLIYTAKTHKNTSAEEVF